MHQRPLCWHQGDAGAGNQPHRIRGLPPARHSLDELQPTLSERQAQHCESEVFAA